MYIEELYHVKNTWRCISSKVFIVLVPTMDADTSKANEARKKKLTLMTPEVFTKKYL